MHEGEALRKCIKLQTLTVVEIAAKSGISRDTIYELYKKEKIEKKYIDKLTDVGINFLSPDKSRNNNTRPTTGTNSSAQAFKSLRTASEDYSPSLVPYYDLDAIGGTMEIFTDGKELVSGEIAVPGFDDCDMFINYSGDSMYPHFRAGQLIGLKRITDLDVVAYGEAHVIITAEHRFVKYLRKGKKSDTFLLVSENDHYDSFEVHKSKVLFLYIVKGRIERNIM